VFVRGEIAPDELLSALDADFAGYEALREKLLSYPKMGQNDDRADAFADLLLSTFADALHGKPNSRGGVFRVGTGTAHEYYYTAKRLGATADGRHAYAPFSANYSPAPTARTQGPISAIKSFTKTDLSRACNGGPFTVEIHDTVFRNDEGEKKVAALIKSFFDLGGHQMQINAVNRDVLLDAKAHPENYPGLIVRVWGWSGYFCELEPAFQDHIIRRVEFTV
jgi:formate C-acetyltransferase